MSTKALFWALEQNIPTNPKIVLIMLSDWYNDLETCAWPSLGQLATKTGLSKRTVQRSISWLTKQKLVVPEARFKAGWQKSNRYGLSLSVIVLQGSHSDHPAWSESPPKGSHSDHPVVHTITDTIKDTINCGEPQEKDLKISDVLSGRKKSRDEIVSGLKYKDGILTPKSCGDLFRDCRASAGDNGFSAELLGKDHKMLQNAHKRVGEHFPEIVWNCMSEWVAFTKHAEKTAGAFSCPLNPSVAFFCKYVEAAADFSVEDEEDYGVTLIAKTPNPLTNTNEKVDNPSNAASHEEAQAIAEKYGL